MNPIIHVTMFLVPCHLLILSHFHKASLTVGQSVAIAM